MFTSSSRYDALNRVIQQVAPYSNTNTPSLINVTQPSYNEASLLLSVDVWLQQTSEPSGLLTSTPDRQAITAIDYNAKSQRTEVDYRIVPPTTGS